MPISPKLPPGRKGWPTIGETLEYIYHGQQKWHSRKIHNRQNEKVLTRSVQNLLAWRELCCLLWCFWAQVSCFQVRTSMSWVPRSILKIFLFPIDVEYSVKVETAKMHALRPEFLKPEALQRYIPIIGHHGFHVKTTLGDRLVPL
jgi:hypothetical protein